MAAATENSIAEPAPPRGEASAGLVLFRSFEFEWLFPLVQGDGHDGLLGRNGSSELGLNSGEVVVRSIWTTRAGDTRRALGRF
jgi:hypothetical protein